AIPGRAAVVDVDNANAAAGEVRLAEIQDPGDVAGRATVHPHHVGRPLVVRPADLRVGGRVQLRVHDLPVLALEVDLPRLGQVGLVRQLGQVALEYLGLASVRVDADDALPAEWPGGDRGNRASVGRQRPLELCERRLEVVQLQRLRVQDA